MSEIQSQMEPGPVAMQFVVTLYVMPEFIPIDPAVLAEDIKEDLLLNFDVADADVTFLPAPTHEGAQDG